MHTNIHRTAIDTMNAIDWHNQYCQLLLNTISTIHCHNAYRHKILQCLCEFCFQWVLLMFKLASFRLGTLTEVGHLLLQQLHLLGMLILQSFNLLLSNAVWLGQLVNLCLQSVQCTPQHTIITIRDCGMIAHLVASVSALISESLDLETSFLAQLHLQNI